MPRTSICGIYTFSPPFIFAFFSLILHSVRHAPIGSLLPDPIQNVIVFVMHVLKFGGTSVGTTASLLNVKNIVESLHEPAIVVVSALGGLTDKLIATARLAASGENFMPALTEITERHHNIIEDVVPLNAKAEVRSKVDSLLESLRRNYMGVSYLGNIPAETLDVIVSFGERMSCIIVSAMISGARCHDSLSFVKTEKWFGKNVADRALTTSLIEKEFPKDSIGIEVTGGFISTDRDSGLVTNLGRGGSDYTAALIAASLDAEMLDIWTDVDGFMTADPRIIPSARVVPEMSFVESMELCSFGAKVIYPPTIYPVFHKNIPIRILNTFNPAAPGTFIADHVKNTPYRIKGVSALKDTCVVTLRGEMARKGGTLNPRTYSSLSRHGISSYQLTRTTGPDAFSFSVMHADAQNTEKILREEFAPELLNGQLRSITVSEPLTTIAIVGEALRNDSDLYSTLDQELSGAGIEIFGSSAGNSDTTINFVISTRQVNDAIRVCHTAIYGI